MRKKEMVKLLKDCAERLDEMYSLVDVESCTFVNDLRKRLYPKKLRKSSLFPSGKKFKSEWINAKL